MRIPRLRLATLASNFKLVKLQQMGIVEAISRNREWRRFCRVESRDDFVTTQRPELQWDDWMSLGPKPLVDELGCKG